MQPDESSPVLDLRVLEELGALAGADDPAFVKDLVGLFLEDALQRVNLVESAILAADFDALERAAHTLKSSSANVGARRLSLLCAHLENMAHDREAERLPTITGDTLREFHRASRALRALYE